MGLLFGLPNQLVLLAVAGGLAAMVIWGYVMWWKRRPTLLAFILHDTAIGAAKHRRPCAPARKEMSTP